MQRRHDIDTLRALAFGLLIAYHLGMLYVLEWGWHIKSSHLFEALQMPMLMLNRWRMDLIFLISGVSTGLMMQGAQMSGLGRFMRRRSLRILLPLVFGMVVIVPIQPYCQGVSKGLVEAGFWQFLARYYAGGLWPEGAFDGWRTSYTWNHLWYLAYLWLYSAVLCAVLWLLPATWVGAARMGFSGLRGAALLVLPAVPLLVYTINLQARFPTTHAVVGDWYNHAVYFTVFAYGWLLSTSDRAWAEWVRLRKVSLGLAIVAGLAYFGLVRFFWGVDGVGWPAQWLVWGVRSLYIWATLCAILGWGKALLNHPWRWLPWANQAVYPWYILHQSAIVVLAYWLVPLKLAAPTEFAWVAAGTVAICWATTSLIVVRVGWVRPLFGLAPINARAL